MFRGPLSLIFNPTISPRKSQNTSYASLITCTRPNFNFPITNITKYILRASRHLSNHCSTSSHRVGKVRGVAGAMVSHDERDGAIFSLAHPVILSTLTNRESPNAQVFDIIRLEFSNFDKLLLVGHSISLISL